MALEAANAIEVDIHHAAIPHPAGEAAGVVTAKVVVPPAIVAIPAAAIVAIAIAPVAALGVDGDPATDGEAVAVGIDVADIGHPRAAAVRIAVGLASGGFHAPFDRLTRIAAIAVTVVAAAIAVTAVVAVDVMVGGACDRRDPADHQRPGDHIARADAVVIMVMIVARKRGGGRRQGKRPGGDGPNESLADRVHRSSFLCFHPDNSSG